MKFRFNAAVAAFALMMGGAAQAIPTIDANYEASTNGSTLIVADRLSDAQTFTVNTSGMMTSASVRIGYSSSPPPSNSITLQIRSLSGGLPSEFSTGPTVLASMSLAGTTFGGEPNWVSFDFADFAVQAGQSYALVLQSLAFDGEGLYVWEGDFAGGGTPAGTYAGGQGFAKESSVPNSTWAPIFLDYVDSHNDPAGVDFSFQTFIESGAIVSAAPEPAAWAMMIVGFGMVGGTLRRRRIATLFAI